ncbi:hypothetical protein [Glycomyces sp. NRRL B-16210]|uniref:hypothetical protein n=1 Tax=Glycomyces sp. NRRL B-16210 TaxID=1463821 RepID=UPI0004BF1516|nr:hypothetical protein [Glycomyces sp. NRRL B-16210]
MTPHDAPEPLYEPPAGVKIAQTVAFLQVAGLFGIGVTLSTVGSLGTWLTRLLQFLTDADVETLKTDAFAIQVTGWTLVAASVTIGVTTWGIGAGKRWAQVVMVVLESALGAAAAIVTAVVGSSTLAFLTVPFAVLPMLAAAAALLTGSSNRWFAQRGWDPWYRRYYSRRRRR